MRATIRSPAGAGPVHLTPQPSAGWTRLWRLRLISMAMLGSACGGEAPVAPELENVAPIVSPVADQAVVLNTLSAPVLEIELQLADPDDDDLTVSVASDDEAVIAPTEVGCAPGPCALALAVNGQETAEVAVTVTVADGRGGESTTSFLVGLRPRLVTTAEDDGPGSLRRVITDASAGEVIGFDVDGAFSAPQTIGLLSQLVVASELSIVGPGAERVALSGSNGSRVLRVEGGADVTVRGVAIVDGVAPLETITYLGAPLNARLGGGALVAEGSRLTLIGVTVTGSSAPTTDDVSMGGGVANVDGSLIIRDSEVSANSAFLGGGVGTLATGASEATTTILGGVVQDNEAVGRGGGIGVLDANVRIEGARVSQNRAPDGAGVSSEGSLFVEAGSQVTGNVADRHGGGIEIVGGAATVVASAIEANVAGDGGGVFVHEGSVTVEGTSIAANEAGEGAGIENRGDLVLRDGTGLESNRARLGAGLLNRGTVSMVDVLVDGNVGQFAGGGITNTGTATLRDVDLIGNSAYLGAGVANTGTLQVEGALFAENIADGGGGLANTTGLDAESDATISSSVFENNTARLGGALHSTAGEVRVFASEFVDNEATERGGAVHGSAGTIFVVQSELERNEAWSGGAVWTSGTSLHLTGTDVRENRAKGDGAGGEGDGGGLYVVDSGLSVDSASTIQGNVAARNGGGIVVVDGTLNLRASTVRGNDAARGGGVYARVQASIEEFVRVDEGSLIAENTVTPGGVVAQGGGLFVASNAGTFLYLSIEDSRVEDNRAPQGGGIMAGRADVQLVRSRVGNNRATEIGGGIMAADSEVSIRDGTVVANEADGSGGGLHLLRGSLSVEGSGCRILGNVADADEDGAGRGGGIFHTDTDLSAAPATKVCLNDPDDISP